MLKLGELLHLNLVRIIFALLISLSLTLAPGASAFAALQSGGATTHSSMAAGEMSGETSADMSDCMKAMGGGAGSSKTSDCTCCDTQNKCPDAANCMTKCCKVIGALKPAGKMLPLSTVAYRQAAPAKPPEWLRTPPAPPPRT